MLENAGGLLGEGVCDVQVEDDGGCQCGCGVPCHPEDGLEGAQHLRCLPVITLNSFWGFLWCIYRDGLVVEFFGLGATAVGGVWVGATAVTAGGFGGNAAAGAGFFFVGWLGFGVCGCICRCGRRCASGGCLTSMYE